MQVTASKIFAGRNKCYKPFLCTKTQRMHGQHRAAAADITVLAVYRLPTRMELLGQLKSHN